MGAEPKVIPQKIIPRANYVRVRLTPHPAVSRGGIALPETLEHAATEGTVLATGPGTVIPQTGKTVIVWHLEGDIVVFPEHTGRATDDPQERLVRDTDIVATVGGRSDQLYPENDYALITPDPAPVTSGGGVHLAGAGPAPGTGRSGTLRDLGPGCLMLTGPLAGLRRSPRVTLCLERDETLIDRRVYWDKRAVTVEAAGHVLVHAADLIAVEEDQSGNEE